MSHMLFSGDCNAVLDRMIKKNAPLVDAIITDPPYNLGFMNKNWDKGGVAYDPELWKKCLKMLKPGGHLLAFGGTRTSHRMTCAIEDAGFEIRDSVMWLYGSGFPKSLNVSKAIDKAAGAKREVVGTKEGKGGENLNRLSRVGAGDSLDAKGCGAYGKGAKQITVQIDVTAPATPAAKQWDGWHTAMKPAHEPITVARKPLSEKTVAANVLKHGTGAINIDACRVGTSGGLTKPSVSAGDKRDRWEGNKSKGRDSWFETGGRWPANVIHDGSECVVAGFPVARSSCHKNNSKQTASNPSVTSFCSGKAVAIPGFNTYSDSGSAARFFYCAKSSKRDRNTGLENSELTNIHSTVKPIALMAYLCRLVTPPGGTVLDPFMGSGTTGIAAAQENFKFIGIEKDAEYFEIAKARIEGS